ncbi:MAG: acetone carboxylase subunit gamma [Solirubrobacteraceae bacterium]
MLRQYACPQCATLLEVDVALAGDPRLHDEIARWPISKPEPDAKSRSLADSLAEG